MPATKPVGNRNKVISCAECRRLKLRCDRQFPCHNCTKRGLRAICPEGSLPTRPKVLLEETERLNRKNAELLERIRLLEDGLESLQAGVSNEPHPLLAKARLDAADNPPGGSQCQGELDEINDSLGTLTIDAEGRSLFLGQTAGIESLFRNELRQMPKSEKPVSQSPSVLHSLGIFSSLHNSEQIVMDVLRDYLPSPKVAWSLTENWFDYGSWLYNFIPKTVFLDQVYNRIYGTESERRSFGGVSAHNAALLFMVFALGSFFDPSRPPDTDDAEQYHQLARTALSCDAILVDPTMPAIRTLLLMAFYHLLRDKNGPQHCWALLGLASHMAQNIGLHRDSLRWKLDEVLVQERRTLFWELYWFAMNQSLNFGRPPSMLLAFCDCEPPRNMERSEHLEGEIKPGFHLRKYQFASECLSQVIEVVLGMKHTAYSTILALDRKVRDSQALKVPPNGASGPAEMGAATVTLTLQRFMLKAVSEMTLMYLHRRYFARAINQYPRDILGCPYGPSVLATYRSACVYITLMRHLFTLQPKAATRYFLFWNHLLAASIVVGSVATKCPACVLAPSAISELDGCFVLFEKAASFGDSRTRPARALTIVTRLRNRAHELAAAVKAGFVPEDPVQKPDGSEPDELSILSGRGRLVSVDPKPLSSTPRSSPPGPTPPRTPFNNGEPTSIQQNVDSYNTYSYNTAHPSLLDNLRIATQQYNATELPSAIPWGDVSMWDLPMPHEAQHSGTNPSHVSYAWTPGMELAAAAPDQNTPYSTTASTPSPPMVGAGAQGNYNMLATQENPEELGLGLGTSMGWESNWQGFMQQLRLGEQYDNDESF